MKTYRENIQYLTQNYPKLSQYCIESEKRLLEALEHGEKEKGDVVLYYDKTNGFYDFKNLDEFTECFSENVKVNGKLNQIINKFDSERFVQVGLF